MSHITPLLVLALLLGGCGAVVAPPPSENPEAPADDDDDDDDDDSADEPEFPDDDDSADKPELPDDDDATEPPPPAPDPFAPRPDTAEGLVNTSADLDALLEFGQLDGACAAWEADPGNRELKLRCGKWMFFYEGFGTLGIPQPLLDWMGRNFPDEAGLAFSNYGLVPDPYASTPEQPRHLGVGPGADQNGTPTLALTCANCHFGQMPDGRYSVGYPNLQYEYGTHMLSLFIAPSKGMPGFDPADFHPDALAKIQPILDRFDADPLLGLGLLWNMLPMLAGGASDIPPLTLQNQADYAAWEPGTMDFAMAPLPIEDGVHTVSRTLPLWGIPQQAEQDAYGMDHALLAWTGSARSLTEFLEGFVIIGGGPTEQWTPADLEPLAEYIESLVPPPPLDVPPAADVVAGQQVFVDAGCQGCHAGPGGSGLRVFEFDEVGTDAAMARWGDADGDGEMCCGVDGELTGGIKAPRLSGVGHLDRLLHNGSLESLEQLLCLEARPAGAEPFGGQGHEFGCDLPSGDAASLLTFLRSI